MGYILCFISSVFIEYKIDQTVFDQTNLMLRGLYQAKVIKQIWLIKPEKRQFDQTNRKFDQTKNVCLIKLIWWKFYRLGPALGFGRKILKGSSNYLYGFTNPNNVWISVGGYEEAGCSDFGPQNNPIIIVRCTDFLGGECSGLGVGGWVSCNPNVVWIYKSVRNIGRSLTEVPGIIT